MLVPEAAPGTKATAVAVGGGGGSVVPGPEATAVAGGGGSGSEVSRLGAQVLPAAATAGLDRTECVAAGTLKLAYL